MFNIWKQKQHAFGLDLSDNAIKVMQLEKSGSGYKVGGFLDHVLAKGIMSNDVITNETGLVNNIANILRHPDFGKIKGTHVVACIPESKAFVRVLQIPKMTEEQAASAVPVEAEQYIPIPLEQAYLDWQIIGERDEKLDVLVTASVKDYIDTFLKVLKSAGLRPVAFEVESAACVRALISPEQVQKNTLILDMDSYRSSLIVVEKGHLQFTSSIPIAGDSLTQGISHSLGVSMEEAEIMKRTIGLDDSREHQNIKAALGQVVDALAQEVRNIIKFHDEHSTEPITQIILCGGSAKLLHLSSYLYNKFSDLNHIDIVLGNPWVNIFDADHKSSVNINRENSLSYTTAIGLAMRAVDVEKN